MSRTDYSKLVEQIYRIDPEIEDCRVKTMLCMIRPGNIDQKTLAYWKTIVRKRGVAIPDRRRKR